MCGSPRFANKFFYLSMRLRYFLVRASQDIAPLSLVRLYPLTGLKHQLRVHMAQAMKGTLGLWWFKPLETVWISPVTRSLQCRFLAMPCMEAPPRLQAYISRHTQAFRKADFFYTLPRSPFGYVHFSSNPFPSIL